MAELSFKTTLVLMIVLLSFASIHYMTTFSFSEYYTFEGQDTGELSIFYNIYIPGDSAGHTNVQRIVAEQFQQIADSAAARNHSAVVRYTTVGQANVITPQFVDPLCQYARVRCEHTEHYDQGYEEVTLQSVYDYCSQQSAHTRVVYIHNKGSLNQWGGFNECWRRHLTKAVLTEDCLRPPDATCNMCGLLFSPSHGMFFMPGNFFTAQCGYIQKLFPTDVWEEKLQGLNEHLTKLRQQNQFTMHMFNTTDPWNGQSGRYAWEIWGFTHPSIRPCDLAETPNLAHWYNCEAEQNWTFALSPRFAYNHSEWFGFYPDNRPSVLQDVPRRKVDYFGLAGPMLRWLYLYGETPRSDSWVYDWFYDGELWRDGVQKYGSSVVEELAKQR